jgi:hypothetical protein
MNSEQLYCWLADRQHAGEVFNRAVRPYCQLPRRPYTRDRLSEVLEPVRAWERQVVRLLERAVAG